MSSELPSTSGRSVFSVFGFGSGHYSQDEDFNSPLESAPESFDASNSLTAVTKKKKKLPFEETVTTEHSPETAPRVRINLPDQSGMVLQSFSQSSKHSSSAHPSVPHSLRRYSTAQEEADDVMNSSEVLTKFNNTLSQTTYMLTKAGGSSTNIYSKDSSTLTPNTSSFPVLTRVKSSPHLSLMPSFLGSPQKESLHGSDMIVQYMRRHQSQSDLLEVAEYNTEGTCDSSSTDQLATQVVAVPSAMTSHSSNPPESVTADVHSSYNSGFGILSRTRQFGAWLTKATDGEKVEVTKKDLNVLAPNSF